MRPRKEQIDAILAGRAYRLAVEEVGPGGSMDDKQFRDFISVSTEDVEQCVMEHGFDSKSVWESTDPDAWRTSPKAHDRLCIVRNGNVWEVFYTERGIRGDVQRFPSYEEARHWLVLHVMESARIELNSNYRLAHPEEDVLGPTEVQ